MGVLTREVLNRYMSEPNWNDAQEMAADGICEAVELDLCAALYGAVITPQLVVETVTVTGRGMVLTSLPVYRVLSLDGVTLVEDAAQDPAEDLPLPSDYTLREFRIRSLGVFGAGAGIGAPWAPSAFGSSFASTGPNYYDSVLPVRYLGGWGPQPDLVDAIMRKAAARMDNRHGDTVAVTGLTAEAPARKPAMENFTDDDMKSLGRYRNLGWAS